jgi:peroxiredoxin
MRSTLASCLATIGLVLAASWSTAAVAQVPVSSHSSAALLVQGKTLDGAAFDLSAHKGKVVLLMFWATDCAVCRDKMHELRDNARGWQAKPFATVLVSLDRRMSDLEAYNKIIRQAVLPKEQFTQLWALDPSYRDSLATAEVIKSRNASTLPITFVVNKKGEIVKRYQGRIPAEVWDDIAELL